MDYHQEFINSIYKSALESSEEYQIPVNVILAQACQESGWGQHILGNTNNIFNIKADPSWTGKFEVHKVSEYINGKTVYEDAKFRVYESIEDSIKDHAKFLKDNPRYHEIFDNGMLSDKRTAEILQEAGYATDPDYAKNLQAVINGKTFKQTVSFANEEQNKNTNNQTDDENAKKLWDHILETNNVSLDNVKSFLDQEKNNQDNIEQYEENSQNLQVYRR